MRPNLLSAALAAVALLAVPTPAEAITVSSTSYSPCSAGQVMADGTRVRLGSVASNLHPLGTRIYLDRPVLGLRRFTVRDRIGHGSQLDVWSPSCSFSIRYGRRVLSYRVGWPTIRRVGAVRPRRTMGLARP